MASEILYDEIPSLDLHQFTKGSQDQKMKFVEELGNAYSNIGFVAVKNHGLSDAMTENLYSVIKQFFTLDEATKTKYENEKLAGQRGYIGKGKEHAKGSKVGDLKEFYHVGQIVEGDDPVKAIYPDNIWPNEVPDFKDAAELVYKTLENTGKTILRAIALFLKLDENYFEDKVHHGNSILRPIHYFPIEDKEALKKGAVRAAEHGDINLITLLMGASAAGLEVKRRDNKWIPITALPDQIIVNVGDMLERLTNDVLKSTIHRVVNPEDSKISTSRYSIPFFMHPRPEMNLTCLQQCITIENPKKHEDISAGDFLMERLRDIGLIK